MPTPEADRRALEFYLEKLPGEPTCLDHASLEEIDYWNSMHKSRPIVRNPNERPEECIVFNLRTRTLTFYSCAECTRPADCPYKTPPASKPAENP